MPVSEAYRINALRSWRVGGKGMGMGTGAVVAMVVVVVVLVVLWREGAMGWEMWEGRCMVGDGGVRKE